MAVSSDDLASCTNLPKLIGTYRVQGGPAPVEVKRAIAAKTKSLAQSETEIKHKKQGLIEAQKALDGIVNSYSTSQ